jgi:hypothetical protein
MIRPTININGSSEDDLIAPRLDAALYIKSAIEALKQVTPHGRDYPGDTDRCSADRDEHYARLAKLRAVFDEIADEMLYIKEMAA